ncbi:MAG: cyclic 2,3-diphosphoglycerate synthase [Gaiellaceae bacterium]|jgi:cyclic 2,3-diphosphoglycerate synthetase|nr:cyclic 2,3-diphosphoglycerate synthase [Gaiellaceae bacterium]
MTRALVVIDGEHYPPVVRDAIAELPYEVIGAWLAGGTEKLRGHAEYGVPLLAALEDGFSDAEVVIDLSDEPVLGPRERMLLASRVLAAGLRYEGADFEFSAPPYASFPLPSLAVIGTGKRVGKTAVTGHVARLLAKDRDVVVVAMGRGGPAEPQVAVVQPTLESLLDISRAGHHAASDYLETAALTGVVTIGCRRAGGGLAGAVTSSNVLQGAALAAERDPDVVVFDGSGAAIPPIDVDARILVSGRGHDPLAYLNAYRVLVSDLVVLIGGGDIGAIRALKKIPVLEASLRLRPISPLRGSSVAVFTTGAAPTDHLDAEVVSVSRNLADRARLSEDLERVDADVYLIEIKAAAIDLVAEAAVLRGAQVVFAENEVVSPELDDAILRLVPARTAA